MGSAGRVLIIPKGPYDSSVTYSQLDMVRYDRHTWICKKACTGVTPSESAYWMEIGADGLDGAPGRDGEDFNSELLDPINRNIAKLETSVEEINAELNNKAPRTHTHSEFETINTEINSINTELDNKASNTHTHSEFETINTRIGNVETALDNKAPKTHTHSEFETINTQIDNVETALDNKAPKTHTHSEFETINTEISSIKTELNNKAPKNHTHSEFDTLRTRVGNVETALDNKAPKNHTHAEFGITLTGTLTAGMTSITFQNESITDNCYITPFTSVYGVNPTAISASNGSITLTFKAQTQDIGVKVVVR